MESSSNNNLDNNDLNEIEVIIIDVPLYPLVVINGKNSETFFILFKPIKHAKVMAIYFANQLFSHFLIGNNNHPFNDFNLSNTDYTITNSNFFAYIAIKQ